MLGIHYKKDMDESKEEVEIQVVGDNLWGVQAISHDSEIVKQPTQIPPTGPSLPATQVNLPPSAPANSERQIVENMEEQDENQDLEGEDDDEEHDGDSNNDCDGEAVECVSVAI